MYWENDIATYSYTFRTKFSSGSNGKKKENFIQGIITIWILHVKIIQGDRLLLDCVYFNK